MSETRQGGTRRRAGGGRDRHQSARVQAPRQPYIQRKIGTFNVLGEEGLSLIERNADSKDKRVLRLSLTPSGRDLTEQAMTIQTGLIERIMSQTPEARCLQVAEAMEDIIRILQTMETVDDGDDA